MVDDGMNGGKVGGPNADSTHPQRPSVQQSASATPGAHPGAQPGARPSAQPGVLTAEQLDAVAVLATTNKYTKQSKWKTFRELPNDKKWPFFEQHFLLPTVAAIVTAIVVIALTVTYVTRPPDTELSVAGFDLQDYSSQLDKLKAGFVAEQKIDDDRLIGMTGEFSINSNDNGFTDDSAKVMTMVTAGDINIMIAGKGTFAQLVDRGLIGSVSSAEGKRVLGELADSGALVDKRGEPTDDATQAYGLALAQSRTWTSDGLPDDMVLGFANISEQTHLTRSKQFIEYLKFE